MLALVFGDFDGDLEVGVIVWDVMAISNTRGPLPALLSLTSSDPLFFFSVVRLVEFGFRCARLVFALLDPFLAFGFPPPRVNQFS